MKDRVGIVTIQGRNNYGNRLQNYAIDRIYRTLGLRPESLVLKRALPPIFALAKRAKRMLRGGSPSPETTMSITRLAAFDSFNELMEYRGISDLGGDAIGQYRFFSVGSDQIWGMGRNSYGEDWRFLQFARPEQRIALAPSFGVDSLSSAAIRRLGRYLKDFPFVSVREESGANFIKAATGRDVRVICDPTLALKADDWRRISSHRLTPQNSYVFAYILGDITSETEEALAIASMHGRVPIVMLSDREKEGELPAGPAEFISLVDCASWVVTDSFHGSVFSSILQTPLTIVHRSGGHEMYSHMFGRLATLANKLSIEHKVYGSPSFDPLLAGNYEGVPTAIENERAKFMNYLEACLHA